MNNEEINRRVAESGDKTQSVFAAEMILLLNMASASSDLVKARDYEEFREASGGMNAIEAAHAEATRLWEQWLRDGEG